MAVRFRKTLEDLLDNLKQGGYRDDTIETVEGGAGRHVDVVLKNGVTVSWDRETRRIWAEGPRRARSEVESYLACLYEGEPWRRRWTCLKRRWKADKRAVRFNVFLQWLRARSQVMAAIRFATGARETRS
jgi:hypothetical protein